MLAIIGAVFPFLLRFLGENTIEKVIAQKRLQMESANALERAKLEADIEYGKQLIEGKRIIRDLQLKEYEHWALWWPKFLIMMAVAWYWFAVFMHVTLGLSDFNIVIADLTTLQEVVSTMVLSYMFLNGPIQRALRKS